MSPTKIGHFGTKLGHIGQVFPGNWLHWNEQQNSQ